MLTTLNLYSATCSLYPNKTGRKINTFLTTGKKKQEKRLRNTGLNDVKQIYLLQDSRIFLMLT